MYAYRFRLFFAPYNWWYYLYQKMHTYSVLFFETFWCSAAARIHIALHMYDIWVKGSVVFFLEIRLVDKFPYTYDATTIRPDILCEFACAKSTKYLFIFFKLYKYSYVMRWHCDDDVNVCNFCVRFQRSDSCRLC